MGQITSANPIHGAQPLIFGIPRLLFTRSHAVTDSMTPHHRLELKGDLSGLGLNHEEGDGFSQHVCGSRADHLPAEDVLVGRPLRAALQIEIAAEEPLESQKRSNLYLNGTHAQGVAGSLRKFPGLNSSAPSPEVTVDQNGPFAVNESSGPSDKVLAGRRSRLRLHRELTPFGPTERDVSASPLPSFYHAEPFFKRSTVF